MTADADRDRAEYWRARSWLIDSLHELPAGVLDGAHGANAVACSEMMSGLEAFDQLCTRLRLDDHRDFIEGCRWHFEHYPHYLGRSRHFTDYETYTRDRRGPLRVADPPRPPHWLSRP